MSTPDAPEPLEPQLQRYSRQVLFAPLGRDGQQRLTHSHVVLAGCGALGSAIADTLVRAGVGSLRIIDRDFVELNNLQRQVLFDEHDVRDNLPKAEAAARKLRRINSAVRIEPVVADLNPDNAERLCGDADLLLDGTDNFETRYLINDLAVARGIPWVYGAVVAAEGRVMAIVPGTTPCLRCIWPEPPAAGEAETCDTIGVIAPAVHLVAALQCAEALKLLAGREDALSRALIVADVWRGTFHAMKLPQRPSEDCPCCARGQFEFLEGRRGFSPATLCGRNAVQVLPPEPVQVDLSALARRLSGLRPQVNAFLLRFVADDCRVTLFADGRAIIEGTTDPARARQLYARYIGS